MIHKIMQYNWRIRTVRKENVRKIRTNDRFRKRIISDSARREMEFKVLCMITDHF